MGNNKVGEGNIEWLRLSVEIFLDKLLVKIFLKRGYLSSDFNYLSDELCEDLG